MDSSMIINFFKAYGWQVTLLATSGILLLGMFKSLGMFKKVPVGAKKYVYYAVSCILSVLACTIYIFAVNAFNWKNYLVLIVAIIGYTSAIYTLYENTGIRTFLKKFVFVPLKKLAHNLVSAMVKGSLSQDDLKTLALAMGADVLTELAHEAEEIAVAKQEEEIAKASDDVVCVNANEPQTKVQEIQ